MAEKGIPTDLTVRSDSQRVAGRATLRRARTAPRVGRESSGQVMRAVKDIRKDLKVRWGSPAGV